MLYIYMYVCMYIYTYHVNISKYKYACTYMYIYVHMYIYIYICTYVYIYTHIYVKIDKCVAFATTGDDKLESFLVPACNSRVRHWRVWSLQHIASIHAPTGWFIQQEIYSTYTETHWSSISVWPILINSCYKWFYRNLRKKTAGNLQKWYKFLQLVIPLLIVAISRFPKKKGYPHFIIHFCLGFPDFP